MRPVVILHSPPAICLSSGHIGHRLVLMLCNCWRATSLSRHVRPPRSFRSQPWLTEIALGSHRLEKNDKRLSPRTTLVDLGCGLCCVMPKSSFEDKKRRQTSVRKSKLETWKISAGEDRQRRIAAADLRFFTERQILFRMYCYSHMFCHSIRYVLTCQVFTIVGDVSDFFL